MLLHHSLLYLLGRGLPGVISFLTIAIYTRILPPEEYGQYALVLAGVALANAILFHWLRLGLLRFLPAYSETPGIVLTTLRAGFGAMAGVVLLVGLFAWLFAPDKTWRLLAILAMPLVCTLAWFELNLNLVQSRLSPTRYGVLSLAKTLLALAGGTGLILLGLGAAGPVLALILATLLPTMVLMGGAWRGVPWSRPQPGLTGELLAYGLPLTAILALNYVISSSDRFLVAWFLGTEAAGAYAAGYDLGWSLVLLLMTIVNLAGYPLVVRAMERGGPSSAQVQLQQNGVLLLAVALPVLVAVMMLAPNIARVVLGALFREEGTRLLPWIGLAAFVSGARLFYVNLAFQLSRKTLSQVWVSLLAALLNVGLNWLWIPRFGLLGAAWATLLSYGVALILGWWLGRRVFPLPLLPTDALKPVGAALIMGLALWPCRTWLGLPELIAQASIGLVTYAVVLVVLDLTFGRGRLLRLLRRKPQTANGLG